MPGNETQKINFDLADLSKGDQERIEIQHPSLRKLFNYLSVTSKKAYLDSYLLSNAVFSKCDLPRRALKNYLSGEIEKEVTVFFSAKKLLRYFVKSFGWLVVHGIQGLEQWISKQKFICNPSRQLTLIDIHLTPEQILKDGDLVDSNLPHLEERLKSKNINYAYVPKFFGPVRFGLYYNMFRLLKKKRRPVISCFQILGLWDYLRMIVFIVIYPFRVFRQIALLGTLPEERLLRFFLWDTMDYTAVKNYARQLFGRKISRLNVPSIRCISWYENQSQDKNFFRGLRSVPEKVRIFGAQLYIWPEVMLQYYIDENEKDLGLIPDRVLVNGTFFLREGSSLDIQVGPSMRYAQLFQTKVNAREKSALLVLLSFFEYEVEKMLEMIHQAKLTTQILLKFHPAMDSKKYEKHVKENMEIVEGNLYSLFQRAGCVVGATTGSLVEAASLGIPAINIDSGLGLNHNHLPLLGKGIIWENASTGIEIAEGINKLRSKLKADPKQVFFVSEKYKKILFCEPTDKKIDEAFELVAIS